MILHCPCCHAQFSAETITQDEAARELLALRSAMPPALLSYLGLFRSEKRALSWERALKLAREVLSLPADAASLEAAMQETIEALRGRSKGPLKNHNYLKRVLESVAVEPSTALVIRTSENRGARSPSQVAKALNALDRWAEE